MSIVSKIIVREATIPLAVVQLNSPGNGIVIIDTVDVGPTVIRVITGAVQVTSVSLEDIEALVDGCEPGLGLPDADHYILSSLMNGTRSWIELSGLPITLENKTGLQVIEYNPENMITNIVISSADGNLVTIKAGWSEGGSDILRLKRSRTTERRSYSVGAIPIDDTKTHIYVSITGYANVYLTLEKFK